MRLKWSWMAVALVVIVGAFAALVNAVPDLKWRATVVGLKLSGRLPEIGTADLARWLMPGSPVYLALLAERPTVEAGIQNPWEDNAAYAKRGEQTFMRVCSQCHGGNAQGGSGPNLLDFISRSPDWKFFSAAKWGRPGTGMAAQAIEEREIWEVHAFLRTKTRAWAKDAAAHLAADVPKVDVPFSRLLNAADHPEDWLMYSGDLASQRHSKLNQINRNNVRDLKVAWATQLRPAVKPLASTPIVANGVMFVTEAPDGVVALDARDGRLLWRFTRPVDPSKLPVCCGAFNRGVAVLGSRVFVATLDAHLVALDAATGKKVWEVEVAPHPEGDRKSVV